MIASPAALAAVAPRLARARRLAVDTEFIGERTYTPVLELLQIADDEGVLLIDVPAAGDLSPLAPAFASGAVEKIFHAASQDLALLRARIGPVAMPVFDTQLAAAMCGIGAQISYSALVADATGHSPGGKHTTSDWSRRPLSPQQLEYAVEDVLYLGPARDWVAERLDSLGRMQWFIEEQAEQLADATDLEQIPDDERFRKVKDWASLHGQELAILRELAAWRESEARARNVPRRHPMTDDGLIDLARFAPADRAAMSQIRRVPQGSAQKNADAILAAIARGREVPRDRWPKRVQGPRLEVPTGVVEILQAYLRGIAEEERIAPAILARTDDLNALAGWRGDYAKLDIPCLHGWRREMIGNRLVALMEGRVTLSIADRRRLRVSGE